MSDSQPQVRSPAPVHCPAENDAFLGWNGGPGACDEGHPHRRTAIEALGAWLSRALGQLENSSLTLTRVPHPDDPDRWVVSADVDPQCQAVVLAVARAGPNDALGIYCGLVLQRPDGGWQGLAGGYVQLCEQCESPTQTADGPRAVRQLLEAAAPELGSPVPSPPEGLEARPRPGWWDDRHVATYLPARVTSCWSVRSAQSLTAAQGQLQALAVRLGQPWGANSEVIVGSFDALRRLMPAVGAQDDEGYWARQLTDEAAGRLLGPDRLAARGRREVRRLPPPPDGPVVVRLTDTTGDLQVELTRQPQRLLTSLQQRGRFASAPRLEVWTPPRAGEHGPIVGDDLLDLLTQLRTPSASVLPHGAEGSDHG